MSTRASAALISASRRASWVAARLASAAQALALLGVFAGQPGDHAGFVASLGLHRAAAFGTQELAVSQRYLEQHLIPDRQGLKLALRDRLSAGQVAESPHADVPGVIDTRNVHRSRPHRVAARTDVHR